MIVLKKIDQIFLRGSDKQTANEILEILKTGKMSQEDSPVLR